MCTSQGKNNSATCINIKIARSKDNKLEPRAKVVKVKPTFGTITIMMSTVLDSIRSIPFLAVTLNVNPHYVSILQSQFFVTNRFINSENWESCTRLHAAIYYKNIIHWISLIAEYIGRMMGRLQELMMAKQKLPVARVQPKSLYSTGNQVPREEVIEARQKIKRGLTAKNTSLEWLPN